MAREVRLFSEWEFGEAPAQKGRIAYCVLPGAHTAHGHPCPLPGMPAALEPAHWGSLEDQGEKGRRGEGRPSLGPGASSLQGGAERMVPQRMLGPRYFCQPNSGSQWHEHWPVEAQPSLWTLKKTSHKKHRGPGLVPVLSHPLPIPGRHLSVVPKSQGHWIKAMGTPLLICATLSKATFL